jgi:hypothetical protein
VLKSHSDPELSLPRLLADAEDFAYATRAPTFAMRDFTGKQENQDHFRTDCDIPVTLDKCTSRGDVICDRNTFAFAVVSQKDRHHLLAREALAAAAIWQHVS